MDRTKLSYALFISLLLLLGVVAGLWFSGFWTKKPVVQPTPPTPPVKPPVHVSSNPFKKPGWCCNKPPSKCVAEPGGASACFRSGGKMFNDTQKLCDNVCSKLKK